MISTDWLVDGPSRLSKSSTIAVIRSSLAAASILEMTVSSKVSEPRSLASNASIGSRAVLSSTKRPSGAMSKAALCGKGSGTFSDTLTDNTTMNTTKKTSGTKTVIALLMPANMRHIAFNKSMT